MANRKVIPASVRETAFVCPHCHAYTTQHWWEGFARQLSGERRVPLIYDPVKLEKWLKDKHDPEVPEEVADNWREQAKGKLCLEESEDYSRKKAVNLHMSECFNCGKIAVWVHERLIYPSERVGPEPNEDLPEDVQMDYEEARSIVDVSARGAAALLRLGIQKLCRHVGEGGKDLNEDIGNLVKKGLLPRIQKALDVVRVIGNEAVHPGVIDLRDDRDTANRLFGLVNAIADQMISNPRTVEELYAKLPEGKRRGIEERDRVTQEGQQVGAGPEPADETGGRPT
jgi:hypothetical protein